MPILWRYLLRSYLQVFFLCVSSFIAILLVTRFKDIAEFAALSTQKSSIFLFILYQVPYILPIAIPISCLIGAILLIQKLSTNHELTAIRAAGLPLKTIYAPLIYASVFLGIMNIHIASEFAPASRALSKNLIFSMTGSNPLFLLQKDSPIKIKHTFVDMKDFDSRKSAREVIFAIHNQSNGRINLVVAEKLSLKQGLLLGKNVTLLTSMDTSKESGFDHVILENQKFMTMQDSTFANLVQSASQPLSYEHLPIRLMLAKYQIEKNDLPRCLEKVISEISRRFSLAIAPFTFTCLGLSFGLEIGRKRRKRGIFFAIGYAAFFLIVFVAAKSFKYHPTISTALYLLPHPMILWFSSRYLKRVVEGRL